MKDAAARAANSVAWWRRLVARKAIPVVRLGKSVRFREDDVERVLRDGVRPARAEAASDTTTRTTGRS